MWSLSWRPCYFVFYLNILKATEKAPWAAPDYELIPPSGAE